METETREQTEEASLRFGIAAYRREAEVADMPPEGPSKARPWGAEGQDKPGQRLQAIAKWQG